MASETVFDFKSRGINNINDRFLAVLATCDIFSIRGEGDCFDVIGVFIKESLSVCFWIVDDIYPSDVVSNLVIRQEHDVVTTD